MWRTNSRAGVQEENNFLLLRFHSWLTNEREAHILVNNSARFPRTSDNGANAAALQASHQFIETMPNKDEADVPKITTNELSGSARLMENSEPKRALVLIHWTVRDLFSSLSFFVSRLPRNARSKCTSFPPMSMDRNARGSKRRPYKKRESFDFLLWPCYSRSVESPRLFL